MVKSFSGNSLKGLEDIVNKFCEEYPTAHIINFAVEPTSHVVAKYIFIVEYEK